MALGALLTRSPQEDDDRKPPIEESPESSRVRDEPDRTDVRPAAEPLGSHGEGRTRFPHEILSHRLEIREDPEEPHDGRQSNGHAVLLLRARDNADARDRTAAVVRVGSLQRADDVRDLPLEGRKAACRVPRILVGADGLGRSPERIEAIRLPASEARAPARRLVPQHGKHALADLDGVRVPAFVVRDALKKIHGREVRSALPESTFEEIPRLGRTPIQEDLARQLDETRRPDHVRLEDLAAERGDRVGVAVGPELRRPGERLAGEIVLAAPCQEPAELGLVVRLPRAPGDGLPEPLDRLLVTFPDRPEIPHPGEGLVVLRPEAERLAQRVLRRLEVQVDHERDSQVREDAGLSGLQPSRLAQEADTVGIPPEHGAKEPQRVHGVRILRVRRVGCLEVRQGLVHPPLASLEGPQDRPVAISRRRLRFGGFRQGLRRRGVVAGVGEGHREVHGDL